MRKRVPPSETWCSSSQMASQGFLPHGYPHVFTDSHMHSFSLCLTLSLILFSPIFPLAHFSPSSVCLLCSTSLGSLSALISQATELQLLLIWSEKEREEGESERECIAKTEKQWQSETETKRSEKKEWEPRGENENGGVQRGSCSVFIHLLISLLTSRLFISLTIHPFILPSTHSASNQPCIHSFTYL